MAHTLSPVTIGNMALSNIGARSSIETFEENTPEAQQIDLHYHFARTTTLEAFDWSFARKRQTLALHSEDAPDGIWTFRYQYPSDCLLGRHIVNPDGDLGDPIPYEVEMATDGSKSILTDMESAIFVYTFDQSQVSMFSSHFSRTLSFALAQLIAYPLTGKLPLANTMWDIFNVLIRRAETTEANETRERLPRDADWIRGRT